MKKFIISDIHGNGDIYDTIMSYLENVSLVDDVTLYINGDLMDRGPDSLRVLLDIKERIEKNDKIKIKYLGGNHELMMYQALKKRRPGKNVSHWSDWMLNGGWVTEGQMDCRDDYEEMCNELKNFLGTLNLYHSFEEKIGDNPILLVHAQPPRQVNKVCNRIIADNDIPAFNMVWTREKDEFGFRNKIGKEGYFTIIGHTPIQEGFYYNKKENFLNIDGGCAAYAKGYFEYDKVPLIEIDNDKVSMIIFNHNNEIINGYHLGEVFHKMSQDQLEQKRIFLNHDLDNQQEKYKEKILEILQ